MASLVLILLLFSAATWLVRHRTAKPADDTSTLSALPFTGYPGVVAGTSFSPDGNQIAFFWDGENDQSDLYVKMIGADSSRRLTSDRAGSGFPAWSPDGVTIAFSRPRSGGGSAILLIPASGGPERKLIDTNASWVGTTLSWSRDAKYLALADRNSVDGPYSLYLMSLETLQRRRLTEAPGASVGDWCPAFSPDGRSLAFVRALNWGRGEIEVLSLDSGKIHTAATDPSWLPGGLTWAPEGKDLIFASARMGLVRLWRVPAAGGEPHVLSIGEGGFAPAVSFRSHRLAYTAGRFNSNIWRTDLAGAAPRHTKVVASARQEGYPELSPDGKKIAFTSDRSGSPEIWTADANGSNQVQLTHFAGPATGSVHWSPDGRQLVFDSHARGQNDVYVSRIDGGSPRLLMAGALDSFHPYWSHDARRIYFASDRTGTTEIWKVPPEGGEPQQVSHHGGYIPYESPDGRFLYFLQPASGQFWSVATSGGEPAPVPGMPPCNANGHLRFAWRPSREGIYFVDIDTKPRPTLKFFRFSTRTLHALAKITNSEGALGLSVSTNGRSFFYGQMDTQATDIMLVDNFR
jgi:Tol biopolymer transport system component